VLDAAGVAHAVHRYRATETQTSYGEAVAAALGVDPSRVFKTLVALVDGRPVVAIVPVAGQLSLRELAIAAGGKKATMAEPAEAERLTGYVVGGISPLGQRRRLPVYLDLTASEFETIYVSAGERGLQVEVGPEQLVRLLGASSANLSGSRRSGRR
jgi:Cys-tRNA(Pro)/Cys-tRNA(Cys) deacylase